MASILQIMKNSAVYDVFTQKPDSDNVYDEIMAFNNMAVQLSSGVDSIEYEVKKKLQKKIANLTKGYEAMKVKYQKISNDLGTSNPEEINKMIEDFEKSSIEYTKAKKAILDDMASTLEIMESASSINSKDNSTQQQRKKVVLNAIKSFKKTLETGDIENFAKYINDWDNEIKSLDLVIQDEEAKIQKLKNKHSKNPNPKTAQGKESRIREEEYIKNSTVEIDEFKQRKQFFETLKSQYMTNTNIENKYNESMKNINIEEMKSTINSMQQYTASIVEAKNKLSELNGTNITFIDSVANLGRSFAKNMLMIRLLGRGIQDIIIALKSFKDYEDLSLSLGIAGGMNVDQINAYRNAVLKTSESVKFSAKEIMQSQELVVKTGYNLVDSQRIVSAAMDIARASFEKLESATDLLNRTMLALDMNSMDAAKSAQILYSAIQSTPLSLSSMEVALRQTGAAFGAMIEMTSKSGQTLEDYKIQSFETMSALTGALALMGKHIAHLKVA